MTDPMDQPVTRREQQATFDAFLPVLMDHISKQLKDRFEDFGQQMAKSFAAVAEQFEQVTERFGQVDKRFEQVDKRFEQVDKRFDEVDKRFEQVDNRFEHVDKRFEQVDKRFDEARTEMNTRFAQVDKRFDDARIEMDKRFDEARIQMVAVVDHMGLTLRAEMRKLSEADLQTMRDDLQSFNERYEDLPRRVRRLEREVFKPEPGKRRRSR
jgi:chromosome segregation ATPase